MSGSVAGVVFVFALLAIAFWVAAPTLASVQSRWQSDRPIERTTILLYRVSGLAVLTAFLFIALRMVRLGP